MLLTVAASLAVLCVTTWTPTVSCADMKLGGPAGAVHHRKLMGSLGTSNDTFDTFDTTNSTTSRHLLQANKCAKCNLPSTNWNACKCDNNCDCTYSLSGGQRSDLFVACDAKTWRCVGTKNRARAAQWVPRLPGTGQLYQCTSDRGDCTDKHQLRLANTNLCLNIWGGIWGGRANLYPCSPASRPTENEVWRLNNGEWATNYYGIPGNWYPNLWWDGEERQMLAVKCSSWAWQCNWRLWKSW